MITVIFHFFCYGTGFPESQKDVLFYDDNAEVDTADGVLYKGSSAVVNEKDQAARTYFPETWLWKLHLFSPLVTGDVQSI